MSDRIALQLWSVRELFDADPVGVLERVAEIGYPAMEMVYSRTGGLTHAALRDVLDGAGLQTCALHCFFDEVDSDLDGIMAAAETLGTPYVVCSWVDGSLRRTADDYRAVAAKLAAAGERCNARGLQFGYHHHDFELADFGGRRGMDWIWDVDPDLVKAEVDIYWVDQAGLDIVEYLRELGDRCFLLHCKDRQAPGSPPLVEPGEGLAVDNAPVGEGVLDIPAALAAAPSAQWLIVEQDFSAGDPFVSAATSLRNLRALTGAPA